METHMSFSVDTNLDILLRNRYFLADLLNGPCRPLPVHPITDLVPLEVMIWSDGRISLSTLIDPEKIDMEPSDVLTRVLQNHTPDGIFPRVLVVRDEKFGSRHIVLIISEKHVGQRILESCVDGLIQWEQGVGNNPEVTNIEIANLVMGDTCKGQICTPWGTYYLRQMDHIACEKLVAVYEQDVEEGHYITPTIPQPQMSLTVG